MIDDDVLLRRLLPLAWRDHKTEDELELLHLIEEYIDPEYIRGDSEGYVYTGDVKL